MHIADRFIPNYFRLEHFLRESITSGRLKPADPIPPESQLCQQFNISRNTVRQALARLVFDGLIVRQRGRGSYVAEPRFQHTTIFPSFEEEMQAKGMKPSHKLLSKRTEPAEGKVAQNLALPEGTPVLVLERQRLVPEGPIQYGKSIFRGDRYQMCIGFSSNSHQPVGQ